MAIDWTRGYSATYQLYRVHPKTWADSELIGGLDSVSVERSSDGDAPLLESGSMTLMASIGDSLSEGYYRIAMVARQGDEAERVDVATLHCASTGGSVRRGADMLSVTGHSVLWPAQQDKIVSASEGRYAPAGMDGIAYAADMLRRSIAAPVTTQASVTLDDHVVFSSDTTVLAAVWAIVRACGCTMRVSGDGSVSIEPKQDVPALTLDSAHARLLHQEVRHELDLSAVPNVYVAIDGGDIAEAVNDDATSLTSTETRGYRSVTIDRAPVRVNGETLDGYAARRLEELSTVTDSRTYTREWWPGVRPGDIVRGSLASVLLDGDMRVSKQSITCGRGITIQEQAGLEVKTWQR